MSYADTEALIIVTIRPIKSSLMVMLKIVNRAVKDKANAKAWTFEAKIPRPRP